MTPVHDLVELNPLDRVLKKQQSDWDEWTVNLFPSVTAKWLRL
ncbi:1790_t:CDS:2 [Ambispora leptoticha]|uniref:1790_t:CDS:1 n=1 Tax=Ambispora leptoticha TaxID=144679 RepID=A0A9N9DGV1_9GLOM|nr:1790_t:CDS:2 [Ambispora leptoticha]